MQISVRESLRQSSSRAEWLIANRTTCGAQHARRGFHLMIAGLKNLFLSTLLILVPATVAFAQPQLPSYTGMVNDFAGKLNGGTKQQLESVLENFRARSGIEIAIVTMKFDDLQGYSIEQYALELGRKWG